MKPKKHTMQAVFSIIILILLITDTNTASNGAKDGIEICLKVIIPSLFSFLIVATYLNSIILGRRIPILPYITDRLQIPSGGESILLLGLIGGYPVGAKLIADLYHSKKIKKETAHILLGYCNNAGPAFIFGIAGTAFVSPMISFILWIILIASAVITGFLLPKPRPAEISALPTSEISLSQALKSSIYACASICGWVIVFKILLSYLYTWFPNLPLSPSGIVLTGILELSNGCIAATQMANPVIRFLLYAAFFAFGGLCVLLQTSSITGTLGTGLYIHGKFIQTGISLILSCICCRVIFPEYSHTGIFTITTVLSIIVVSFSVWYANNGGNRMQNHV